MLIKPVEGRLVRDPATLLLVPAEGLRVPDHDPHWQTLIRFGDVTVAADPAAAETAVVVVAAPDEEPA